MQQTEPTEVVHNLESHFGAAVRWVRQAQGMTQVELSDRLKAAGIPMEPTTVTRLENGKRPVRLMEAYGIAQALDISFANLMAFAGAALDQLRDQADQDMARAHSSLVDFLTGLQEIKYQLTTRSGVSFGVAPEDYYNWVRCRVEKMYPEREPIYDHYVKRHVFAPEDDDYVALKALVEALGRHVVIKDFYPEEDEDEDG